jgi:outer membrane protein TolC
MNLTSSLLVLALLGMDNPVSKPGLAPKASTPALEARLEPVWDTCVDEMLEQSPDIVQRKTAVRKLRDALALASASRAVGSTDASSGQHGPGVAKKDLSIEPQWFSDFMLPLRTSTLVKDNPENRQQITQQEAELEQTIRRQVLTLARNFQSIDANYKQFQTAKRLTAAAAARLDAQRAYYEEGRITSDRFFDAVSQYATAVGTEAQNKATYNTSIVGLNEAKGTLLADYGIVVAEGPKPGKAIAAGQPKTDEGQAR